MKVEVRTKAAGPRLQPSPPPAPDLLWHSKERTHLVSTGIMGNSRERGVAGSRSAGLGRRRSGQRPVVGTKGAARPQEGEWDTAPCGALDSRGSLGWTLWGSSHREHPRFSPQPGPPGSPASPGPLDPEAWLWEDKAPVPAQEPTPRWVTRTAAPGGHTGALLCPRGGAGGGV